MLKIQKPVPKTLVQDGMKIKMKTIKKSKAKKVDELLSKATAKKLDVPLIAHQDAIKKHKKHIIAEISKKTDMPLKKTTLLKANKKAINVSAAAQKQVHLPLKVADVGAIQKLTKSKSAITAEIPTNTKAAKKSLKRPMVLAPPESPVATPKLPLTTTTKPIVALPKELKKKEKKQKENMEQVQSEKQQKVQKQQAVKLNKQQSEVEAVHKTKVKKFNKKSTAAVNDATTASPKTKLQKSKVAKRAYQKQMKKNAGDGKNVKPPPPRVFEPIVYDEEAFNKILTLKNVEEIAKNLKQQVEADVTARKSAIFSDFRYLLNVSCFKISSVPKRMVKLGLKHSLISVEDDVVIIVNDLKRGARVDYEPTVQYYEDLFQQAGIKQKLAIVPFNQLKQEYHTFEAVRKFGNTYDYFLCDGRIVGHVVGFCGKTLQKPRTTIHAIRLYNAKNIQHEFEKSLRRTAFKQLHKGNLISIPIGNHNFTAEQLAENVLHVVEELKTLYPGGLGNIRNMHLKIDIVGTISMPIYMSLAQAPAEVPYVVGPREKRLLKLKKEANEVLSKFVINKDADIIKLTKKQAEHKQRAKEMRKALLAEGDGEIEGEDDDEKSKQPLDQNDDDDDDDELPMDNDDGIPTKRARVEPKVGRDISTSNVDADNYNDDDNIDEIESEDDEDEGDDFDQDEEEGDDENGSEAEVDESDEEVVEEEGDKDDDDEDDDDDSESEEDEDDSDDSDEANGEA